MSPESAVAHFNLGLLHLELNQLRSAHKHLRRAVKVEPNHARARYALGEIFHAKGRHPRAVKHYSRAFALDPSLQDVRHNPELLFNRLSTWASMKTYLGSHLNRRTRQYDSPNDLVELLVPESAEVSSAEQPSEEDSEN